MVRSMIPLIPWTRRVSESFGRLENEMANFMDRFFGGEERWGDGPREFNPRMDLVETEGGFEISVELPGMKAEDFHVEFRDGALWVSGERKEATEEKGKTFHRVERHFGHFHRMIPLPGTVDEDNVQASYKDGVLAIYVPKSEAAKPKQISVTS